MRSEWRALGLTWAVFAGFLALTDAAFLVVIHALGGSPERIERTAAIGLTTFSMPAGDRIAAMGLPEPFEFFLVNALATVVLYTLYLLAPLTDCTRMDRFPAWVRRRMVRDPTLVVMWPFPSFRRIQAKDLRVVFAVLRMTPLAAPAAMGVMCGIFTAVITVPGHWMATTAWALTWLLPHGVFELSAIFLAYSSWFALYGKVRPDLEAGRAEAVWEAIRPRIALRAAGKRLAVSLLLLAVAAVIEAYATEPIAVAFGGWIGLEF
jgi:hypothetical protein